VSTSCSLLHTPVDLDEEAALDLELKSWLAFAKQKVVEVVKLADALAGKKDVQAFEGNAKVLAGRKASKRVVDETVRKAVSFCFPLGLTDTFYCVRGFVGLQG
jgi:5-methyltetrahydropteroyltriglutamate--homocysteine methyltransferase